MFRNIRQYENLHIVLWLIKDTCWILDWKLAGIFMIVPTFSVAVHITWKWRNDSNEFFHSLAICSWITANGIWMIGEFYYDDTFRPYAIPFFILGLIAVGIHYVYIVPRKAMQIKKVSRK